MCFSESLVWQHCTERHWLHSHIMRPASIYLSRSVTPGSFTTATGTYFPAEMTPTCISSQEALSRIPLDVNASSQIIRAVYHQVLSFHIAGGLQMEFFFIVHDHKLSHVSYRTGPVEDCKNGKSMAFKSPQLQRTRAVMQTPVSEKPSRNLELYLNTNDKNKRCSIHTNQTCFRHPQLISSYCHSLI